MSENILPKFIIFYFFTLFMCLLVIIYDDKYVNIQPLNSPKCNPIKSASNQRYFKIDNQLYPKSVLLHKNKSIDFQCLNQNKRTKVILFWTDFYGNYLNHLISSI